MSAILKEPVIPKVDKLRSAAQGRPCVLCGVHGYTVPAHCNDVTVKGIGRKAPGFMLAYVCTFCHDKIDGRAGALSKDEKRRLWLEAYWKTVAIWFREGLVKVA